MCVGLLHMYIQYLHVPNIEIWNCNHRDTCMSLSVAWNIAPGTIFNTYGCVQSIGCNFTVFRFLHTHSARDAESMDTWGSACLALFTEYIPCTKELVDLKSKSIRGDMELHLIIPRKNEMLLLKHQRLTEAQLQTVNLKNETLFQGSQINKYNLLLLWSHFDNEIFIRKVLL